MIPQFPAPPGYVWGVRTEYHAGEEWHVLDLDEKLFLGLLKKKYISTCLYPVRGPKIPTDEFAYVVQSLLDHHERIQNNDRRV